MKNSSSILLWIGLVIIASLGLYRTSDRVNQLTQNLSQLNASIESERQSIHILKADWVYLANPERVEKVAKRHLALRPTAPEQVAAMNELTDALPPTNDQVAVVAVGGAPMATIKSTLKTKLAAVINRVRDTHIAAVHKPVVIPASATVVASNDTGHINDHMNMQRTASAQPLPDSIGTMISGLDSHQ